MKNFLSKIAAIAVLLTAVAFSAASCSKDNDSGNDIIFPSNHSTSDTTNNPVTPPVNPPGNHHHNPSISVLPGEEYVHDGDIINVNEEFNIGFTMASNTDTKKELISLVVVINDETFETVQLKDDEYTYERTLALNIEKARDDGMSELVISATVTDIKGEQASVTITLTIDESQELVVESFEWERDGGNSGTGLESFGLKWESNQKEVYAVITPVEGAELFEIPSEKWAEVTTTTEKAALFGENGVALPIRDYRGVSVFYSNTYDDVIATLYNGEYYLIHVTMSEVTFDNVLHVTITGEWK